MGKGKDPDPYLWLTDLDADPGGLKTYESYGSGSRTLFLVPGESRGLLQETPTFLEYRCHLAVLGREEVFMEGPLEPNMGPSLADVLLCTFESTNAGFSSFPLRKLLS
jgi:hypothetical protein